MLRIFLKQYNVCNFQLFANFINIKYINLMQDLMLHETVARVKKTKIKTANC